MRGALTWTLRTQYHERLTEAHTHLKELNGVIAAMTERYQSLVRTRQAPRTAMSGTTFRSTSCGDALARRSRK